MSIKLEPATTVTLTLLRHIRGTLYQAQRQWSMYAENTVDRDLLADDDFEAELYRKGQTTLDTLDSLLRDAAADITTSPTDGA